MSFSADTKNELCRVQIHKKCCAQAEAYGILLYCNTFSAREARIVTENRAFAARLPRLFDRAFGLRFDERVGELDGEGKLTFVLAGKTLRPVFAAFGYDEQRILAHHVNFGVLEEECCRASFMRGAFLAGGSVTDPGKRYHLELATDHYNVDREVYTLLLELGLTARSVPRKGNYVTYFKQSETIADFLTLMGAPLAAMELMTAKVEKELRNGINRRVNCDTANLEKMVAASMDQMEAIRRLEASGRLAELPEKLRQTARLRVENPEASLSELAQLSEPPVTKSCLNHRLRKIMELSK